MAVISPKRRTFVAEAADVAAGFRDNEMFGKLRSAGGQHYPDSCRPSMARRMLKTVLAPIAATNALSDQFAEVLKTRFGRRNSPEAAISIRRAIDA